MGQGLTVFLLCCSAAVAMKFNILIFNLINLYADQAGKYPAPFRAVILGMDIAQYRQGALVQAGMKT
jgi:hypothetical protein